MRYIDADKLIDEIERLYKAHSGKYGCDEVGVNLKYLKDFISSRQQVQPDMIQWTGNNLKEVIDFTGKSPKFGEWFKSWEEYENYVHSHNDILKLFCEDGSHYEVPVGAWIVKTPDGHNVPSVARFIHAKQEQPEGTENKQKPVMQWPNLSNCKRDCKTCFARCLYRKEQNKEQQPEVVLDKLVNEEFASHSRTTEYGLEVTYNRAELYQLIKRMALVFKARKEE